MNAQQLSRRHVMQLAAGALASAGLVRGSLAASGSDTRAKAIITCGPPVHTYRARGKGFMVF